MYISKVTFKSMPKFIVRNNDLNNEHKFIMSLFPDNIENFNSPRSDLNIIFRKETLNYQTSFIIQSKVEPSVDWIKSQHIKELTRLETKNNIEELYNKIIQEESFSYKIRVNTVINSKRKNIPIRGESNIEKWWIDKCPTLGFNADKNKTSVLIETATNSNNIKLSSSTITGIGYVNDKEILMQKIENGIGKSKNYGFGLMMIGRNSQ